MTTAAAIKKKINRGYVDTYLKRRLADGTYEADWVDITRYVTSNSSSVIDYSLDSGDLDLGLQTVGSLRLQFNNREGKFNDVSDSRSLWAAYDTRHLSKIKIEAGYLDDDDLKISEIAFTGLLDDRTIETGDSDNVSALVFALESAFKTVDVPAGALSSSILASQAIFILCTRSEILAHMTVDLDNIVPDNDITIDEPSEFVGRKLDDVLSEIMLLTNSVLLIDQDGNLIVRNRTQTRRIKYTFHLNAADFKSDNIYAISGFNSGRQRMKNLWSWSGTLLTARSEDYLLERYGVTKKSVSSSAITDADTKQEILDHLRDEWQFPKREIEIETDYLANELEIFDTVTLDIQPSLDRGDNLPLCGTAVAGTSRCAKFASGILVEPNIGFKVLAIRHDLINFKTTLKLREKGNQLNDGYFTMILTKAIDVAFTAETTKDIDVGIHEIDAAYAKVEVYDLDPAEDGITVEIDVERPNTDTVRLVAGTAITKNFRVLITEVEA